MTATTAPTDPRDDPQAWVAADPLLTQAEAEWYAANWRAVNARIEHRDPHDPATGLTRVDLRPSRN